MADDGYMKAKFKEYTNWKEAVYSDYPVILIWCDNYRQQRHLMDDLYTKITSANKCEAEISFTNDIVRYRHIDKKFVFKYRAMNFRGYGSRSSAYIDMRYRDAF